MSEHEQRIWAMKKAIIAVNANDDAGITNPGALKEFVEAVEALIPESGMWGEGSTRDIYYCEQCDASHEDFNLINHADDCGWDRARRALDALTQPPPSEEEKR